MNVGVRELKQRLSECIERAARGESITVTDRGKPRAVLGPVPGVARLQQGVAEGWITAGSGEPLSAVRRAKSRRSVREVIDEDRGA